jgi:hypothetical protein
MLSTIEVVIFSSVLFLLPITLYSLYSGTLPPESTWLGKYYHAEKLLLPVGNIFVLSICLMAMGKLAIHFGNPANADGVAFWSGLPFSVLFFVYVAFWLRAALKLRRMARARG